MSLTVNDWLASTAAAYPSRRPSSPSRASGSSASGGVVSSMSGMSNVGALGLDLGGGLCGACVGVAATETSHEGWFCGSCFDHCVAVCMHIKDLLRDVEFRYMTVYYSGI